MPGLGQEQLDSARRVGFKVARVSKLLTIGEFSARCGLSAGLLRTYAAEGLLVPAAVDAWSGYRYGARHQFPCAALIRDLRRAGITLREFAGFLHDPDQAPQQRLPCR